MLTTARTGGAYWCARGCAVLLCNRHHICWGRFKHYLFDRLLLERSAVDVLLETSTFGVSPPAGRAMLPQVLLPCGTTLANARQHTRVVREKEPEAGCSDDDFQARLRRPSRRTRSHVSYVEALVYSRSPKG